VFPNYGRRKNEPVFGSAESDLEYYASGCRRTLADPNRRAGTTGAHPARRHRERAGAPRGLGPTDMSAGGSSSDEPPPSFGPPGDDDIPF